jgi:hypothetical protein
MKRKSHQHKTHHNQIGLTPTRLGACKSRGLEQFDQPRRTERLSARHRRVRRLVLFGAAAGFQSDCGASLPFAS